MTVKELIDKLQQFDEDKLVLVEDTEYKEFQAIDIELALLNLMISLEPLRVLRTLRYTPRRGWNGSCASNISIVINDNDYID